MGWRATIVTEEPPPPQINGPTMSSSALNQRLLSIKKTCIDGEGKKEWSRQVRLCLKINACLWFRLQKPQKQTNTHCEYPTEG